MGIPFEESKSISGVNKKRKKASMTIKRNTVTAGIRFFLNLPNGNMADISSIAAKIKKGIKIRVLIILPSAARVGKILIAAVSVN